MKIAIASGKGWDRQDLVATNLAVVAARAGTQCTCWIVMWKSRMYTFLRPGGARAQVAIANGRVR